MLPPEWLPTSSTGPCSGIRSMFRTSPRNQMLAMSQVRERFSRMKSGSRSSRSAVSRLWTSLKKRRSREGRAKPPSRERPGSPPFWLCLSRSRPAVPAPLSGMASDSRSCNRLGRVGRDLGILLVLPGSIHQTVAVDPALQAAGGPAEPLGGPLAGGCLGVPDEVVDERVRVGRMLDLGDVPALLEDDLPRARQRIAHIPRERKRHERVLVAPDEHRRRLELLQPGVEATRAVRFLEVDVAGRGAERHPRVHRAIRTKELLDGGVGGGGGKTLRPREKAPQKPAGQRAPPAAGGGRH